MQVVPKPPFSQRLEEDEHKEKTQPIGEIERARERE